MAFTYSSDFKGYVLNKYSNMKLDKDKILLTTNHGGWVILDNDEFELLRHGKVEEDIKLYNLLKQEGIIMGGDEIDRISGFYKQKLAQLSTATTLHIITPTLRCNHKCVYCYAKSKPPDAKEYDMDEDTAKEVVDFIFQCPSKGITLEFQGGEPLLNYSIIKFIVDYANKLNEEKKKKINFRLVTNLTLMDEEKLEWFVNNDIGLHTSLDGPKEVHNKNRKYLSGKGSYDIVVDWIKKLKEKNIHISCMPTVTKYSLSHWKDLIDEYVNLGLDNFWLRKLNVGGFAVDYWEKIGYTSEEFLKFWKKSIDYIFQLNKEGIVIIENSLSIMLRNILFSKKYNHFVCLTSPCGCAWGQVSYNHKGDIYTCDEARSFDVFKLGNVKETTYKELYSSWKVLDMVDLTTGLSFDCQSCVYHPFCGPCIVDEYGEHGNIIKKPNSFNCRIKKGMLRYIFEKIILDEEKFQMAKEWVGLKSKNIPHTP